jgi:cytochrome P450
MACNQPQGHGAVTAEDQWDAMAVYGHHDLLREMSRDPRYFSSVLTPCIRRVRSPTETRHVTEVFNVAAMPDQVHQAGLA